MFNLAKKSELEKLEKMVKILVDEVVLLRQSVREAPLHSDDEILDGVIPMTPEHDERAMKDLLKEEK